MINLPFLTIKEAHLGTISLKSSILRRPAGVSPILMSIKTMGRVVLAVVLELIVGDGGDVLDKVHNGHNRVNP